MAISYSAASFGRSAAVGGRLARRVREAWEATKVSRDRARVRAIFHGMADRELKDLGFTRSEIDSVMVDDSGDRIRACPTS